MSFFARIFDHLFNQVLVDTLANSRWFQRFAVRSQQAINKLNDKSKPDGGHSAVQDQFLRFSKLARETRERFQKELQEELKKINENQLKYRK